MNVKRSKLYRTLCRQVRKQDHAELLRMLELAATQPCNFDASKSALSNAFLWARTPQGHGYWWELHHRILRAQVDAKFPS